MQEEIRLEKYNAERQIQRDEEEAKMRRVQLEDTWFSIYEKKKAFMDYFLKSKEDEDVREWIIRFHCLNMWTKLETFTVVWVP